MGKNLKILHLVQEYFPAVGGMPEVVRQLSERLVSKGHRISVATSFHADRAVIEINGVHIIPFKITGNEVEGYIGESEAYREFLIKSDFDLVVIFAAQQWSCDLALPLLSQIKGKKVFVPTGFSYFTNPAYKSYYDRMKEYVKLFDAGVFLSDDYQDVNFCKLNGIKNPVLIPNGASANEFGSVEKGIFRKKYKIGEFEKIVLHVGGFTGAKGQLEAIRIFLNSSFKRSTLVLIGKGNKKLNSLLKTHPRLLPLKLKSLLQGRKILILELPRIETVQAFFDADVFLFPSNIECSPIVLFEAMAAGLPFLSSEAGNSVEIVKWSEAGKIIPGKRDAINWVQPDLEAGAGLLDEMLTDEEALKAMSVAGRKIWQEKFTWEKIADQYEQLYLKLNTNQN